MRGVLIALLAGVLTLSACGPGAAQHAAAAPPGQQGGQQEVNRPAPDFTLTDQFGRTASLHDYRGKVVILAFVDSRCTTVCPLTTQSMAESLKLLGGAAGQVQLLGVDSNPEATAVSDVMEYSRVHDLTNQWQFLAGSLAQLEAVWTAYQISAGVMQGKVEHTPALIVIDPSGNERYVYITPMAYAGVAQAAELLAGDASKLLPSHPRVLPVAIPAHLAPGPVSLPIIAGSSGSPSVEIGSGPSQLVVYWASWLPDAGRHLADLNQYQLDVARKRLPAVVAVDLLTTEADAAQPAHVLDGAGPFLYPVAQDGTGRVADLYGVRDLAWYSVVDSQGRVTWYHDGWMSLSELEAAVHA